MPETLTIRLPEKLRKDLARMSTEDGVPMSVLVRRALNALVAAKDLQRARAKFIPLAQAQGYYTDEDIFKIPT